VLGLRLSILKYLGSSGTLRHFSGDFQCWSFTAFIFHCGSILQLLINLQRVCTSLQSFFFLTGGAGQFCNYSWCNHRHCHGGNMGVYAIWWHCHCNSMVLSESYTGKLIKLALAWMYCTSPASLHVLPHVNFSVIPQYSLCIACEMWKTSTVSP
jgi:hypothetical protein